MLRCDIYHRQNFAHRLLLDPVNRRIPPLFAKMERNLQELVNIHKFPFKDLFGKPVHEVPKVFYSHIHGFIHVKVRETRHHLQKKLYLKKIFTAIFFLQALNVVKVPRTKFPHTTKKDPTYGDVIGEVLRLNGGYCSPA